jgi:hypothetical protein
LSSRTIVSVAALVPLVGLAACLSGAPPEREPTASAASALTSADTCPGTRWIGALDQSGSCPTPLSSAWSYQPLFAGAGATIPAGLDRYCLYELTHAGLPSATDLGNLPGHGVKTATQWLDADCMVVAPLGATANAVAAITPELDQSFASAVEVPTLLPTSNGPGVRVAVVDSWPTSTTVGTLEHGFGMAGIIRRLACGAAPSPDCYMTLAPHLALNLLEPGVRDNVAGGYFGFQGRLAWSILNAVQSWQSVPSSGKLVINLSVGWDAQYNADELGGDSMAVKAARAALEYAACSGALVIAAVGNAATGPSASSGPMYPAAWNQVAAPACAGAARPLVYAVGGVDARDQPLGNARPGSRAPLAAPAFQVPGVMTLSGAPIVTGPFTGSSSAAAVTSAVAAAVWHQNGSLTPQGVMDLVRASAVVGPDLADFCAPGAPCTATRRVSLARAVEAAASTTLSAPRHGWGTGTNPVWSSSDVLLIDGLAGSSPLFHGNNLVTPVLPAGCSSPIFTLAIAPRLPAYPAIYDPCPSESASNDMIAPAVCPQPGFNPCPACAMLASPYAWILDLGISERVEGGLAYAQVLSLSNGSGVVARYDLARATTDSGVYLADGLSAGKVYKVTLPAFSASGFKTASIAWIDGAGSTASSELIVQ